MSFFTDDLAEPNSEAGIVSVASGMGFTAYQGLYPDADIRAQSSIGNFGLIPAIERC